MNETHFSQSNAEVKKDCRIHPAVSGESETKILQVSYAVKSLSRKKMLL